MIRIGMTMLLSFVATGASAQQIGRASCASATCHGGVVDRGPAWNHALTKWLAEDPHTGAGLLLKDADAAAIVVALNPAAENSQPIFDQVLRQRCIGCHTAATPEQCSSDNKLDDRLLAEGVSCESCHGPAKGWLEAHLKSDWMGDQRFAAESGMRDTESIVGRTTTCVECHVGSRSTHGSSRDMNHDVIAAGHPVLRFDLLTYNASLPKHWSHESSSEKLFDASSIRVRRTSRALTLAAAAQLAAQRAQDSQQMTDVPWPELSDYDCFACHQSLSIAEYRLPANEKSKNRSPLRISDGLPIWNAWHTIGQKEFSKRNLEALAPNRIARLPEVMSKAAMNVAQQYEQAAQTHLQSKPDPVVELDRLRLAVTAAPPRSWHHAAILYLDVDAILHDLGKTVLPLRQHVEPLLRFNRDHEQHEFQSPISFNAMEFQQAMIEVMRMPRGEVAISAAGEVIQ